MGYGRPDAFLIAKIIHLKEGIKRWRKDENNKENPERTRIKETVARLETEVENRTLTESELNIKSNGIQKILELEKMSALDLKQKSRIRWTVDGDKNTKFFHGFINCKNRRNRLNGLFINGTRTSDVKEIRAEVFRFFKENFHEHCPDRPILINPHFQTISMMDSIRIEARILAEEVKAVVWACGGKKAPGPDGLTFKFLKEFWHILSPDVMLFIRHFEYHGSLSSTCNSSFITLAPKTKDPISLNEFISISLIRCLYKIISKVLATRIKTVIRKVIGEVQSTYVEERNILDGPLIVNEIYAWAKKIRKKVLLFKVDFDKAFDYVNWGYLDSVLSQMGFGNRWRGWIHGCLSSSWASVIVNGAPTKDFNITCGVRQSDPLSPFCSS